MSIPVLNGSKLSIGLSGALFIAVVTGAWALAGQIAERPTRDEVSSENVKIEHRLQAQQIAQEMRTEKRLDKIDDKLDKILQRWDVVSPTPRRTNE